MFIHLEELKQIDEIAEKLSKRKSLVEDSFILQNIVKRLKTQREVDNNKVKSTIAQKRVADPDYGRGYRSTMSLINTKTNKICLQGTKSYLVDKINKWEEFCIGKKMPKSYNLTKLNQILAERCGEWTSPKGIMGIYKIITEKEIDDYV